MGGGELHIRENRRKTAVWERKIYNLDACLCGNKSCSELNSRIWSTTIKLLSLKKMADVASRCQVCVARHNVLKYSKCCLRSSKDQSAELSLSIPSGHTLFFSFFLFWVLNRLLHHSFTSSPHNIWNWVRSPSYALLEFCTEPIGYVSHQGAEGCPLSAWPSQAREKTGSRSSLSCYWHEEIKEYLSWGCYDFHM